MAIRASGRSHHTLPAVGASSGMSSSPSMKISRPRHEGKGGRSGLGLKEGHHPSSVPTQQPRCPPLRPGWYLVIALSAFALAVACFF